MWWRVVNFHVPTKALLNLQVPITEELKLDFGERRLEGGLAFRK